MALKVFAYCAVSFKESMRKAAGVPPLTCPPYDFETFPLEKLEGNDLIFFDLHGSPGEPFWYELLPGDPMRERIVALTAPQLRTVDLGGTIVFALNCYLGDDDSPMLDALLDAGASYVIAGEGKNWAGSKKLMGANRLGFHFRRILGRGLKTNPLEALTLAKRFLTISLRNKTQKDAVKDTLAFRAYYRKDDQHDHQTA